MPARDGNRPGICPGLGAAGTCPGKPVPGLYDRRDRRRRRRGRGESPGARSQHRRGPFAHGVAARGRGPEQRSRRRARRRTRARPRILGGQLGSGTAVLPPAENERGRAMLRKNRGAGGRRFPQPGPAGGLLHGARRRHPPKALRRKPPRTDRRGSCAKPGQRVRALLRRVEPGDSSARRNAARSGSSGHCCSTPTICSCAIFWRGRF